MAFDMKRLAELKRISSAGSSSIANAMNKKRSYDNEDPNLWKPTYDANGNSTALIRLLPSIEEGELPWVRAEKYFVNHNGSWYVENSPTMIGKVDPMDEVVNKMWTRAKATNDEALKDVLRKKYRKNIEYVCAIYVIDDKMKPENNGKVMLYRFKKQIMDKILEKQNPSFGEDPINVFDWVQGCNLRMRIYHSGEFPRYDKCVFEEATSALPDEVMMKCAEGIEALNFRKKLLDPSNFKTEAELRARIAQMGIGVEGSEGAQPVAESTGFGTKTMPRADFENGAQTNAFGTKTPTAPAPKPAAKEKAPWESDPEDDFNFDNLIPSSSGF